VFDVVRVRVTSIVKPPSPVMLHVGGLVQFRIMSEKQEGHEMKGAIWSANQPHLLDVN